MKARKPAKRAPRDFEASKAILDFGRQHGFSAKTDWPATFRNWLRREIKWRSKHPGAKLTYAEKLAQDIEQLEQNEQQKLIGHVADQ